MIDRDTGWFVVWQKRQRPRLRLFCFPYAGGGAHVFRSWNNWLPDTIELVSAHPPSRWSRLKHTDLDTLETFAAHLADSMIRYDDTPYACFGHSLGCLVSFQVAQERRRRGESMPVHMIMSGRTAPHVDVPSLGWHLLDDASLIGQLRRFGGTPEEVITNPELMAVFLPSIRRDVELADHYRPIFSSEMALPCSLATYNGLFDAAVKGAHLDEWQRYTAFNVRSRWFSGGHFYLREAQESVLSALVADLAPFTN